MRQICYIRINTLPHYLRKNGYINYIKIDTQSSIQRAVSCELQAENCKLKRSKKIENVKVKNNNN